jgi:hypothetical protein
MIQGCRYLQRSMDRWLLSKNSTTRLKDSKVGTGLVCCEIVRSLLQTRRVYIYTLVLTRLLVDHEYNINVLSPMSVLHPSSILPFIISRPHHYVSPNASFFKRKHPFCRMMAHYRPQVSLPNPLRRISCRIVLFTKLGPPVSPFPVPIFGVNNRSGRCSSPVRPVQARKPQINQTGLPSSKLTQPRSKSNTGQQRTHPNVHPSKTQHESAPVKPV